jgi:hypothetical protein
MPRRVSHPRKELSDPTLGPLKLTSPAAASSVADEFIQLVRMVPPFRHDGLSIAICSAIVSGPPIPPAFFGSSQDFVDFELEYEASDDYLNCPRVFDVTLVMRTTLRGWRSFDVRLPLLNYVRNGEPVFARITGEHRNLHRRREAPASPVAIRHKPIHPAGHIRGSRNRPYPAARARVTELSQESLQELCLNRADLVGLQYRSD